MSFPTCSIVIPCYNAEQWIARSIHSALNQSYPAAQIIVIDDGSSDGSLDIIKSFGERITWKTGPNLGGCQARNLGLECVYAEFVMFLDADDYIETTSLGEWVSRGGGADVVFGPFAHEKGLRRIPGVSCDPTVGADTILCRWLSGSFTPTCSVLWRRSFLLTIGGWNPRALRNQDGEVMIRALLMGARIAVAQQGLGVYVQHESADRVSKGVGRDVLLSELDALENLWAIAQAQLKEWTCTSFAQSFYRIAYEAFATRVDDIGYRAIARARQLGLRGHVGTLRHRALSNVLGLRTKLWLTGLAKGRRGAKLGHKS